MYVRTYTYTYDQDKTISYRLVPLEWRAGEHITKQQTCCWVTGWQGVSLALPVPVPAGLNYSHNGSVFLTPLHPWTFPITWKSSFFFQRMLTIIYISFRFFCIETFIFTLLVHWGGWIMCGYASLCLSAKWCNAMTQKKRGHMQHYAYRESLAH